MNSVVCVHNWVGSVLFTDERRRGCHVDPCVSLVGGRSSSDRGED